MSEPTAYEYLGYIGAGGVVIYADAPRNNKCLVYRQVIHKAEQAQGLTERAVLDILCRWSREDGYTYADATHDLRVLAAARPQAAEPGDERARFEAWARSRFIDPRGVNADVSWAAWCAALDPAAAGGETP